MKTKTHGSNSNEKGKDFNSRPFTSPHKQFQLLYRTCDRLPSSQQYQSVFFLKHKKISPEHCQSKPRKNNKRKLVNKKKNFGEDHHDYDENDKTKKPVFKKDKMGVTKTTAHCSTNDKFPKESFTETFRETIELDKTRIKKVNNLSNSNTSRYLNSKLIAKVNASQKNTKKNQNRIPSNTVLSNQVGSNTSPTKVLSISNQVGKLKKSGKKVDKKIRKTVENEQNEYILLGDLFIEAASPDFERIQEKLNAEMAIQAESQRNEFLEIIQKKMKPMDPEYEFEEESSFQESIQKQGTEIVCAKNYLINKIKIIQRWWRTILLKKINLANQGEKKHFPSQVQSEQSIYMQDDEKMNNLKQEGIFENFFAMREQTALNYMNYQRSILNKMLEFKKIETSIYSQKMSEIQAYYQGEMIQIGKLREKVNDEADAMRRVQSMMRDGLKINEAQNQEIFKQLFTVKKFEENNVQFIQNFNRKKSTACHYMSSEQQNSLYKKPPKLLKSRDEEFEEQSENSNKIELQNENLNQFYEFYQDRQQSQVEIEKRQGIQLGMICQEDFGIDEKGISTSVVSIHKFMTNFLRFYAYFYKEEFLKLINMPYGYSHRHRLRQLQGHINQSDRMSADDESQIFYGVEDIIGAEVLDDFHEHHYQEEAVNSQENIKQLINFQKIHHRAILDCFNQSINCFRPYYYINGPPYTWNYSEKALTFYFIAQQNIQQVFQKTQYRVLKTASSLCGTIVQNLMSEPKIQESMTLQQKLAKYRECINMVLIENRDERLNKVEKQEIEENNYRWEYIEDDKTSVLLTVSNLIMEQFMKEVVSEWMNS